ncbi:hypothetical protein SDC9_157422 [bioreactor metagenome]|uniref:Uncharacterized protein n=1 Tax=bioreactor metagenome TaxID=1076179 RepID=A0A645F9Y7_9ZZZZ
MKPGKCHALIQGRPVEFSSFRLQIFPVYGVYPDSPEPYQRGKGKDFLIQPVRKKELFGELFGSPCFFRRDKQSMNRTVEGTPADFFVSATVGFHSPDRNGPMFPNRVPRRISKSFKADFIKSRFITFPAPAVFIECVSGDCCIQINGTTDICHHDFNTFVFRNFGFRGKNNFIPLNVPVSESGTPDFHFPRMSKAVFFILEDADRRRIHSEKRQKYPDKNQGERDFHFKDSI